MMFTWNGYRAFAIHFAGHEYHGIVASESSADVGFDHRTQVGMWVFYRLIGPKPPLGNALQEPALSEGQSNRLEPPVFIVFPLAMIAYEDRAPPASAEIARVQVLQFGEARRPR